MIIIKINIIDSTCVLKLYYFSKQPLFIIKSPGKGLVKNDSTRASNYFAKPTVCFCALTHGLVTPDVIYQSIHL